MNNIELYKIQISLSEGTVREIFPKLVGLISRFSHKKELLAALDDYVKMVPKKNKQENNKNIAFDIAKRYKGIDWRDLIFVIDSAVNKGLLNKNFLTT